MTFLAVLATAALLAAAGYAHYRIPFHTAGRARALAAHSVLAVVAAAFGYVMSAYAQTGAGAWLSFLAGFGAVHVPAAIILFVKRASGAGKS
jgi:hypothetical protein